MERYVIRCTSPLDRIDYYFERFKSNSSCPVVGPLPKLFDRKEAADLAAAFLKDWAKTEYPGLEAEVVLLPEKLKDHWKFEAKDLAEARKMAGLLGYRKIKERPCLELLAMRRKITERWYFVLSIDGLHADLRMEDRNRWCIMTEELEKDRIGCWHLTEAEDRLADRARTQHII